MSQDNLLRVSDIVSGTCVDGPGFRTSIYFAGCNHCCLGCHNQSTWDFNSGRQMSVDELIEVIVENGLDVTFSGGDPLYQATNLLPLCKRIHALGKTIWCYTGFTYDECLALPGVSDLLSYIEVLVDGPYIEQRRNINLLFRGSDNQRLIDVKKSKAAGDVKLWESEF